MSQNRAIFITYMGDEISNFAADLISKEFSLEVFECEETRDCFKSHGLKHTFDSSAEIPTVLSNLYYASANGKVDCAVIVIEPDTSLSTLGFDTNFQLRRLASLNQNVWIVSSKGDADEAMNAIGSLEDSASMVNRTLAVRVLKSLGEYDIRVGQAIKDDMFPLDPVTKRGEPTGRARASSHPELPSQPLVSPGECINGLYKNSFGRRGKDLHSDIFVKKGVLQQVALYYRQFLPEACLDAKNYVVVDEICDELLDINKYFVEALASVGVECEKIVVPSAVADEAGETSTEPYKNNEVFTNCVGTILTKGISKHSCIISVGGGVVNNMCGVLAGMIYRGVHLVHFTTTTMGMLDAALDFKQAINHELGKNLLGCYYPAEKIIIDPECCRSLSVRHIRNGIAEALKHGLCQSLELVNAICDPVREFGESAFHDPQYIEDICKMSIEIKVPTLDHYSESDFNEMCPQYGHSVGHAVESVSWTHSHEALLHGEAVSIGMCVSAEIAYARGYCDKECLEDHYRHILDVGLPAYIPATITTDMILKKMTYDKHYVKVPSMGLTAEIGEMAYDRANTSFSFGVTNEELLAAFEANMARSMYCYPC
ncbi:3-dehydroquinate synthase-domain-containing protein [Ochromonadaceae sp. CCMP2298]|nr:3-dehydroquinate synthase-domain-containing protein [Ochromonadaceae sp. CCMP2298]|mmetsp:Transcript_5845/g.12888  ORF Transcript_5845/g.12888 Transcript_5845/m.12888 type:complete len:599 (+) Transcript_5845:101-1897(+)